VARLAAEAADLRRWVAARHARRRAGRPTEAEMWVD
jgi:hypothetical protein